MGYCARDGSGDGKANYVPRVSSGPTLVQQKIGGGTDKIFTFSFDAPVTPGNLVVMCVSYVNTFAVTSVDSNSDTALQQSLANGTGSASEIWSVMAVSAGTDVHVNTADTTDLVINMSEWRGISSATAEAVNNNIGNGATVTTLSVTPVSAQNLIVASGVWDLDVYLSGPTNGFSALLKVGVNSDVFQESAYLLQSSATSKSTGWGLSATRDWAAAVAAFGGN